VKLGLFVTNQYPAGESMAHKVREALEQVKIAREAGFDLICAGQHYLSAPYQMPTSFPFLARLCAEAGQMQVAATVILVPLHNPVELAESVATMDAICDGRFIFGVGLGYRVEEYTAFGVRQQERVGRLIEALDIMKLLWTQDQVEYRGRYYQVPLVRSTCRTVQKPYPPIWVAANHDMAIKRAGRLGLPWLVNPHATVSMVEAQLPLYRGALVQAGVESPVDLPMMREMYVANDKKAAFSEAKPYLAGKYQAYADWGQDKALPGDEDFSVPFEELSQDRFLIGSPEDIVQEIKSYEDRLGISHMILRLQWPGLEQAKVLKQLEIMAEHVIPHLKG